MAASVQSHQMRRDRSASSFSQEDAAYLDADAFLNLDSTMSSAGPSSANNNFLSPGARSSFSSTSSAQSTPHMSQVQPQFTAPSHQYELHAQTALPMTSSADFDMDLTAGMPMLDINTEAPYFFPEQSGFGGLASTPMPAGIAPEMMSQVEDIRATPAAPVKPEPQPTPAPTAYRRPQETFFPGIHTQRQQQQQAMQQQVWAALPADERINRMLQSMRPNGPSEACRRQTSNAMPHISKMKKEEEDMDEDERLLASEEGKKLSSKERRQLRNKVSARAFRSRRKEYITQLECEINKKTQQNVQLQREVDMQAQQIAKLEQFTRSLLKSPAFKGVIDDMIPSELYQQGASVPQPQPQMQQPAPQQRATFLEAPQPMRRDIEWALDYSPATSAWNNTPVFAVELPDAAPALQTLDGKVADDLNVPFLPVADGFYADTRNEKAEIVAGDDGETAFEPLVFNEEMDAYEAPEDLMDVFAELEAAPVVEKKSLDELFPGVGVEDMLQRLEKVVGGEAAPEELFDVAKKEEVVAQRCAVDNTNKMLGQAESLYRRIGMMCGGN